MNALITFMLGWAFGLICGAATTVVVIWATADDALARKVADDMGERKTDDRPAGAARGGTGEKAGDARWTLSLWQAASRGKKTGQPRQA